MERKSKRIFLDYASVTPIDSQVEKEIKMVQKMFWANPSSLHSEGQSAKNILEEARIKIARILHCRAGEVFFTSGGTESLNIAILGICQGSTLTLPHIIISTIEHSAVLEPIKFLLKNKQAEVSFVSPGQNGIINPETVKKEMKENTILVVIQHANGEIGTIQPVREISKMLNSLITNSPYYQEKWNEEKFSYPFSHPVLLVDASQSVLYENISIERLGADILVFDGIKMHGPRGMGILAVKHGVNIFPITFGGGQESNLRPGTENVAGAAGLSKAFEIAVKKREKESKRLLQLRDYAIKKILEEIPDSSLNGDPKNRLPNNINVCFGKSQRASLDRPSPKIRPLVFDSEFLVIKLDTLGFAVSAASACHTLSSESSSYVIESLGKPECASSSLRITLGRTTKKSDLDKLLRTLKKIIK